MIIKSKHGLSLTCQRRTSFRENRNVCALHNGESGACPARVPGFSLSHKYLLTVLQSDAFSWCHSRDDSFSHQRKLLLQSFLSSLGNLRCPIFFATITLCSSSTLLYHLHAAFLRPSIINALITAALLSGSYPHYDDDNKWYWSSGSLLPTSLHLQCIVILISSFSVLI